jgi:uncharacterized protein YukE
MQDHATLGTAHQTIRGVLTDLQEVADRLSSNVPMDDLETERTARILDRLSEETGEAAQMVRSSR